jgi:peptidoglycan-N-acetylglucosamine deacetylase
LIFVQPPYLLRLLFNDCVWRLSSEKKIVYLTFDDGPHPEITPWVLEQLKHYNAKATFFLVGKNVNDHPEVVEAITKRNHHIGNHTYDHLNGWKTSTEEYLLNIDNCNKIVKSGLFRPPYGKLTWRQAEAIKKQYKIVMWDLLTGDYNEKLGPKDCLKHIRKYSRNGSVIVFHDSQKAFNTLKELLPDALAFLTSEGYSFEAIPYR